MTGRRLVLVPHVAVETPRSTKTGTRKSPALNLRWMHVQLQGMWDQRLGSHLRSPIQRHGSKDRTRTRQMRNAAQDQRQAHDPVESESEVEASVVGDREVEVFEEEKGCDCWSPSGS